VLKVVSDKFEEMCVVTYDICTLGNDTVCQDINMYGVTHYVIEFYMSCATFL
jgi:hypothetical protein